MCRLCRQIIGSERGARGGDIVESRPGQPSCNVNSLELRAVAMCDVEPVQTDAARRQADGAGADHLPGQGADQHHGAEAAGEWAGCGGLRKDCMRGGNII